MNKKLFILIVFLVFLLTFSFFGGLDYILSRTVFLPDYNPEVMETGKNDHNESRYSISPERFNVQNVEYTVEIVAENLEIPWEMVFVPEQGLLVTERAGRVILLDYDKVSVIQNVHHIGEGGLLGMALDPQFELNNYLYLYYTYRDGGQIYNRVSRFAFLDNDLRDEEVILDGIPGARFHNGGRIRFGPDNKLYITTGDALDVDLSQDINSLAGKILRINPDGTIPEDNPFANSPVYSYGHRNPQGLAWHPVTGYLYASEHGPNRHDEINLIQAGKNYGWPLVTCENNGPQYENPIICYRDFTLAPSGMDFVFLEEIEEVPLFVAGLRGNMIMRIDFDHNGQFLFQEPMFQDWGRIRTVLFHNGSLYVATNNLDGRGIPQRNDDKIYKITPVIP